MYVHPMYVHPPSHHPSSALTLEAVETASRAIVAAVGKRVRYMPAKVQTHIYVNIRHAIFSMLDALHQVPR